MKKENIVYYFSGTGNSFHVAKQVAAGLNAKLLPTVSLNEGDEIDCDTLCFVFPVYDFKPPKKVLEIISSLSKIKTNHCVGITTYGVALASTLKHLEKHLESKQVELTQGFGVKMPHNAMGSLGFTEEENITRNRIADEKTTEIIAEILYRQSKHIEKTTIFEGMTLVKKLPYIIKLLYILIFRGVKALEFKASESCIHCSQC